MMRSSIVRCSFPSSSSFSSSSRSRQKGEERRSSAAFRRPPRRGRLVRQNMGKIIAEDSEDEEDMSIRSSTITMDMLEKAEDQFWEESIDTGEGSYDDFDDDTSDVEKEDDDDGLGEGTVLLRRKRRKNNSKSKTKEESRATRTLENSILRARQFASTENAASSSTRPESPSRRCIARTATPDTATSSTGSGCSVRSGATPYSWTPPWKTRTRTSARVASPCVASKSGRLRRARPESTPALRRARRRAIERRWRSLRHPRSPATSSTPRPADIKTATERRGKISSTRCFASAADQKVWEAPTDTRGVRGDVRGD